MQQYPPGLAIHVGTGDCRDTLERTARLAAAAGITRQRTLPSAQASRAEVIGAVRQGAAGLDPRGHLVLAFTGPSDRGRARLGRPPEVAWRLSDGSLPLTEVAALLGTVPPTALITVIADTCYAAALSRFAIPATVVLLAACGADQEILAQPATGFAARLEQLVLADGQPNPACTSYLWLNRQFRRDSPDVERPLVWTNRPFVWSQRPFHPISGPSRPARPSHPGRPGRSEGDTMTSTAPTPGRPTRPCAAELLAAVELPVTTAVPLAAGPKLPPYQGD